jgi:chemotaxis protein CheC
VQHKNEDADGLPQDAIKEIGNIGMGHAATALSQMLGKKIHLSVPKAKIMALAELPRMTGDPGNPVAGLVYTVLGDVNGKMALIFPGVSALRLADMLLKRPAASSRVLGEMGQSAVKEAGNTLVGAFMASLNEFLKLKLLISLPELVSGKVGGFLDGVVRSAGEASRAICVEARLGAASEAIGVCFILIPDEASLQAIFRTLQGHSK